MDNKIFITLGSQKFQFNRLLKAVDELCEKGTVDAEDVDVMTAAFKEYTGVSLKKEQRQSIRKKLEQAKERVAKHREITKEKTKNRGQVR